MSGSSEDALVDVAEELKELKAAIEDVKQQIDDTVAELRTAQQNGDSEEVSALRIREQQLRATEHQLRATEHQLLERALPVPAPGLDAQLRAVRARVEAVEQKVEADTHELAAAEASGDEGEAASLRDRIEQLGAEKAELMKQQAQLGDTKVELMKQQALIMQRAKPPQGGETSLEAITSRMAALEARVAAQNEMYAIIATLFDYNDDNASVTTVPAFKQELIRACSAEIQTAFQGEPLVFCTLTGLYLPKQVVTAGHIWKRAWHAYARTLMGFEIDDPRNGLLIVKPVMWLFDTSKICFLPDGGGAGGHDHYVMRILDCSVAHENLVDMLEHLEQKRLGSSPTDAKALSAAQWEHVRAAVGEATVRDFEGRRLQSVDGKEPPMPHKRALSFHALRALSRARASGWITAERYAEFASAASDYEGRRARAARCLDWIAQAGLQFAVDENCT